MTVSLLRKIFGGKSYDDERALGEERLAAGDFGQAKLAFERALDKAPTDAERAAMRQRVDEALDAIASARLAMAREHLADRELELATQELEGALEVVRAESLRAEIQREVDSLDGRQAMAAAEEIVVSDEERLAALAGTWEEEQDEEYAALGDSMTSALLDLQGERFEEACGKLEALVELSEAPRYLWYELGKARVHVSQDAGAAEALRAFLELMGPDEGGEARLGAHVLLAKIADERGDEAEAVAELERAAEAFDDDPRPLLELGRFLRSKGRAQEAIEVLELAVDSAEGEPGWLLLQELGLARADAGLDAAAIETLEQVIAFLTGRQHYDFPVFTASTLARLHEKAGNARRAADMFRHLSQGSDRARHYHYHHEAGRLLRQLGAADEAARMLKRAALLAEERATALEAVEATEPAEKEALEAARAAVSETRAAVQALLAEL